MPFHEGFGDLRIAGAKRVPLVGEVPSDVHEPEPPPLREPEPPRSASLSLQEEVKRATRRREVGEPPAVRPRRNLPRIKPDRRGGTGFLSSTNMFGLTSKSELNFPELYRPISTKYWEEISEEERLSILLTQVSALEKTSYRDHGEASLAETAADYAYEEAVGRRNEAMRRRRKPMNYDERKRYEEIMRRLPLYRRYDEPVVRLKEGPQIVKMGPLETPVVIAGTGKKDGSGIPALIEARVDLKKIKDPPKPRRGRRGKQEPEPEPPAPPELPTFNPKLAPKARLTGGVNPFGLTSRSELFYPEAYRDISTVYWRGLTREQREMIAKVQATAMEKVGFERGTEKRFIDDFDPALENRYTGGLPPPPEEKQPSVGQKIGVTLLYVLVALAVLTLIGLALAGIYYEASIGVGAS